MENIKLKRRYDTLKGNVELKEKFLDNMLNIDKNTEEYVLNTKVILRRFGEWEEELKKDIYDFTIEELNDTLYNLRCGSIGEVRRIATALKKYLIFARSKNLGNLSLNLSDFFAGDELKKFVWKNVQTGKIIDIEQLRDIVRRIDNPRDKLSTWLLFMGIMGKHFDEVRLLKKADVDTEKKFIVTNEKTIENVPDEVMNLIEEVNDTNEYYSISINKEGDRVEKTIPLKINEYLLRPLDNRKNVYTEEFMTASAFRQCFSLLKKYFQDDYPYISPRNIYISGMLWAFNNYIKENNIDLNDDTFARDVFLKFREENYPDAPTTLFYDFYYNFKNTIAENEERN